MGEICIGVGPTARCLSDTATVYYDGSEPISWRAFSDALTGIGGFRWAVGPSSGSDATVSWADVGMSTLVPQLALPSPGTYYVSVRCRNGAGLEMELSLPLVFDDTPPTIGPAWWGEGEAFL